MNTAPTIVLLSAREVTYLKNTKFLPQTLAQMVESSRPTGADTYTMQVSRSDAEEFRSAFTERLARAGFNAEYEPTAEGKMLEGLIDRFYLR